MSKGKLLTLRSSARTRASGLLRRVLCSSGLTQQEAAARVGKDARQLRRWLSGDVPLGALELLAALLPSNDEAFLFGQRVTKSNAPQSAPARACTRSTSEGTSCVQGWATTPQGEASEGVARKAAA